MTRKLAVLAAVAAAFQAAPARAVVPQVLTYSGYLKTSAGAPVTTLTNLTFRLYAAPTGGAALWTETVSTSPSPDGWFSVVLGTTSPLPLADLGNDVYLGIQFESEAEFAQRARLTPSHAAIAVDWTRVTNRPGACTAGQFLTGYDASGNALCGTPPGGGTGGVSSIVGGAPITATGTGAVTVSLTGCPAANQILQWSGAAWACIPTPTPVGGGVSSVQVQQPLIDTGTATAPNLGLTNTCGNGQILKWSSGTNTWACGNDNDTTNPGTVTSVAPAGTAGNPITVANGTGAAAIDLAPAGAGTSGYLTAADHATFSGKVSSVVAGPFVAVSSGLNPRVGLQACPIGGNVPKWDAGSSTWNCAPDADSGGTLDGVQASAPLAVDAITNPRFPSISMPPAGPAGDGYLSSVDWSVFAAKAPAPAAACGGASKLTWDGAGFGCAADADTTYTAGPGLQLTGTQLAASFAGTGAQLGSSANVARADHDHGRAKLVASFANTADSITGGTVTKGDGALVINTSGGVAAVIEIKNVNSGFAFGAPGPGSSMAFQANASGVTQTNQTAMVFFGGVIGVGSQTGGYGFRFQGDGAGGRTLTVMTMRSGGLINNQSLQSPMPAGMHSYYAVNRGASIDFYVDGSLFSSLATAGMGTQVFQAYTVRMEQPAAGASGDFGLSFLTLELSAL